MSAAVTFEKKLRAGASPSEVARSIRLICAVTGEARLQLELSGKTAMAVARAIEAGDAQSYPIVSSQSAARSSMFAWLLVGVTLGVALAVRGGW